MEATYLSCWRMLDGGLGCLLHLAMRSRLVSTQMDASVIPPWNEAVSGTTDERQSAETMIPCPLLGSPRRTYEAAQ
jgi:hypothetical protein